MNADRIEELLNGLGSERISRVERTYFNNEGVSHTGIMVRATCPLAPWLHGSGKDSHPSFAVMVEDDDRSKFNCKGCGQSGSLIDLLMIIQWHSKEDMSKVMNEVNNFDKPNLRKVLDRLSRSNNGFYTNRPDVVSRNESVTDPLKVSLKFPCLNEDAERKVNEMHEMVYRPEPYKYLKENRGLSDELIKNWKIGWHPGARRIAVPQYDFSGRLVNIGGRFIPSVVDFFDPPKWMHAKGFKREAFLFGEDRLQLSDGRGTIFIVEGMFDAIYLVEKGIPNVVAILGSDLAFLQIQKIIYWANHLVIVPDGDDKGFKAAKKIQEQLGKKLNVSMFNTPMGKDPDELSDREIDLLKSRFLP